MTNPATPDFTEALREGTAVNAVFGTDYQKQVLQGVIALFTEQHMHYRAGRAWVLDDPDSPILAYVKLGPENPNGFPHINFALAERAGLEPAELAAVVAREIHQQERDAIEALRKLTPEEAKKHNLFDGTIVGLTALMAGLFAAAGDRLPAPEAEGILVIIAATNAFYATAGGLPHEARERAIQASLDLLEVPAINLATLASAYSKMLTHDTTLPPLEEIDAEVQALMTPVPGQRAVRL